MKLHILNLFLSRNGGGIFTVIKELYQSGKFKESEYNNMFFWGYKDEYSDIDSIMLSGKSKVYKTNFKAFNKIYYSRQMGQDFIKEITENDIVHLHSMWLYLSIMATGAQEFKNVKKIISIHGMLDKWALKNGKFKKEIALILFEQKNLKTADCIHALCEQEFKDIRRFTPNTPVAIIPNGIYLPDSIEKHKKTEIKSLLFIGRIHPKKGLNNLINAWAKIKPDNWRLVIAGPDEINYLAELKNLANNLQVNDTIKFTTPKFGKDKEEIFQSSHAFILPSFSEGLPMTILEAWSYKLPVLMTPECNLPDGFETNSAINIKPEVESICNGLNKLFSMSEDERIAMGNNGFELVSQHYTWGSVAEKMIELYDWVSGKIEKPDFVRLD